MPRKARLDAPGALHPIIVRGIERRAIFRDDTDRGDFLNRFGGILGESQTLCFAWSLVQRVASLFEMPSTEVLREGNYARTVEARSVLCFWANRELGISTVELARRLKIAQPTVIQSIARGEKVVAEKRCLMSTDMK
jgi:hypothetical protein